MGLTLNKARSVLTTSGVTIGVTAVIVMLAVSAGAEAEIADQINALGANLIVVMPSFSQGGFGSRPRPGLEYKDIEAIAQDVSGINGVSAEQSTTQNVSDGGATLESISVVGTTFPMYARDRPTAGVGGAAPGCAATIPAGGGHPQPGGRADRRAVRRGRIIPL